MKSLHLTESDIDLLNEMLRRETREGEVSHYLNRWRKVVGWLEPEWPAIVDEYTNDVWVREILQQLVESAPQDTAARLKRELEPLDKLFIERTDQVGGEHPYFYEAKPGHFWLERIPRSVNSRDEIGFSGWRSDAASDSGFLSKLRNALRSFGRKQK